MNYSDFLKKIENYTCGGKYFVKQIGESAFGRKIFAIEKINGKKLPTAILVAGIHARENITCDVVCKMLDENLFDDIFDFNVSVIAMANPDGVELSKSGVTSAPLDYRSKLIEINCNMNDFSMWKANGRGVDLNNNFDAGFGKNSVKNSFSSSGYQGAYPLCEPESKSIFDYTISANPFFSVSYHSKGEEIYFNYFQKGKRLERDEKIAKMFADKTGYAIKNPERVSSGGYKDFCVEKLKIPAITIEVGSDDLNHPISEKYLDEIFEKNKDICFCLKYAYSIFCEYFGLI